jgi:DNA-binding transcriptional LysR family regulator
VDWDDIQYFVAVAQEGSISGAARALEVNHSTVSRRIRGFEESLGVRLFDRLNEGYALTSAGEEMMPRAQAIAEQVSAISHEVLGRDGTLNGELHVTTADAMATSFVMPHVVRFAEEYPDVDLHLNVSNTYLNLGQREADVAIRASNSPPENLIGVKLARLAFAMYGSKRYLARLRKSKCPPRLIEPVGGMLHLDEANLSLAALRQGAGVALMPCFMGDIDRSLRRYREPDEEVSLELWLLTHPDLRTTVRVRAFRDFFARAVKNDLDLLEGRCPVEG